MKIYYIINQDLQLQVLVKHANIRANLASYMSHSRRIHPSKLKLQGIKYYGIVVLKLFDLG